MISSSSNAQVKQIIKLQKSAKIRKKENCFIVEGIKLIEEAFFAGKLKQVYCSETASERYPDKLEKWKETLQCEIVNDSVFLSITDTVTPQGVLGIAEQPFYSLTSLLKQKKKYFILLDDLRDPGNLGTIIRTAEGAGMDAVILSRDSVDLFNPKTVRATMGSIFRIPFFYSDSLPATMEVLKNSGISLYGCMMEGSRRFDLCEFGSGTGIVIGNEANGISEAVKSRLTDTVRIPMAGQLESLNASVAAALLMYELARKRFNEMEGV